MTGPLTRYGREVLSVFDLLGRDEVDLTAALGWTLTQSPALLTGMWHRLHMPGDAAVVDVDLERADALGRTDIELTSRDAAVVIEAKQGWLVPGESQLLSYAPRLARWEHRLLVTLSDSSSDWAATQLPLAVADVPVVHLPWDEIRQDIKSARRSARASEKFWLEELDLYLKGATSVRDAADQWVYCVVVSNRSPDADGSQSFWDYVHTERVYFHPYGGANGWPKSPPRFMAFRSAGLVRQINRVQKYMVVPHLCDVLPGIAPEPDGTDTAHIIYSLGPDIPLGREIPTKGTYATGRVWALLDQILTQPTLGDAVSSSKALAEGLPPL